MSDINTSSNEQTPSPASSQEPAFVSKPVNDLTLDSATKAQISNTTGSSGAPNPLSSNSGGFVLFLKANKIFIIAIILGLGIIGTLALFAFKASPEPQQANIALTFDIPPQVESGGETVVKVTVGNQDTTELQQMELELVYPADTTYVTSNPKAKNITGTLFDVANLSPGQSTTLFIKTKISGSIGDEKIFRAKLNYRFSNATAEFEKTSEGSTKLAAAGITLDLSGPATTTNTQLISYTLTYANHASTDINRARVELQYPTGFVFADSEPKPTLGKNIWDLGTVGVDKSGQITIKGSFSSSQPGEGQTFEAKFLVPDAGGSFNVQATTKATTTIATQPLLVTQQLPGKDGSLLAKPGDTLNYEIRYQNNATIAARGVNIVVTLDSTSLDITTLRAEGAQIRNNTITWNASSLAELESVEPNEEGKLNYSVQIKNPPVKDRTKNVLIKSTVKIKSDEYDTYLPGNTLEIKVASIASLNSELKYVSGELPPTVGRNTTYTVTLNLKNLTNDYSNGILTAFIPVDSSGFDKTSVTPSTESSKIQFDPSSGKLTWNVGSLPAHTGDFTPPKTVSFNIRINPSAAQVGDAVTLLKDILYTGTDSFTSQDIKLTTTDVETNSFTDPILRAKGKVQQ